MKLSNVLVHIALVMLCIICSGCSSSKKQKQVPQQQSSELATFVIDEAIHSDLPLLPSMQSSRAYKLDAKKTVFEMTSVLDFVAVAKYLKDSSESLGWRLIDNFEFKDQFYATFDRPTKRMVIHAQQKSWLCGPPAVFVRLCVSSRN